MTQAQTEKNDKPEILSIRAAGKRGILPLRTLYRLAATGKLPVIRSGKTMYINYTAICEQLQNGEGGIWE
jgi:hypothetical protein